MKLIYVDSQKHGAKEILVDDEDYEFLLWLSPKWSVIKDGNVFYAVATKRVGKNKTVQKKIHRLIMGVTDAKVIIDHWNGNGLDNQKRNLRVIATGGLNSHNRNGFGESKFLGVSVQQSTCTYTNKNGERKRCVSPPKWLAAIKINGKQFHLGRYKRAVDAAKAFDVAAIKHYGEDAKLNFPSNSNNGNV